MYNFIYERGFTLDNKDKVKEYINKIMLSERISSFTLESLRKRFNCSDKEVLEILRGFEKEGKIKSQYLYLCDCGFQEIYKDIKDTPIDCPLCERDGYPLIHEFKIIKK